MAAVGRLPTFICAGAPKAGSTTLYTLLAQHPEVYLPPEKELHFFDLDENYARGVAWYAAQFRGVTQRIVGEATPGYLGYEYVPERMARTLDRDLKLIFVLRNPVDRAYSEYLHNLRRGLISDAPFEQAILWEERDRHLTAVVRRHYSFLSRGLYFRHLSNYRNFFSREQMIVLILEEDLGGAAMESVSRVLSFLGASDLPLRIDDRRNRAYVPRSLWIEKLLHDESLLRKAARKVVSSAGLRRGFRQLARTLNTSSERPPQLSPALRRQLLLEYFDDDIRRLERFLDRGLETWYRSVGAEHAHDGVAGGDLAGR